MVYNAIIDKFMLSVSLKRSELIAENFELKKELSFLDNEKREFKKYEIPFSRFTEKVDNTLVFSEKKLYSILITAILAKFNINAFAVVRVGLTEMYICNDFSEPITIETPLILSEKKRIINITSAAQYEFMQKYAHKFAFAVTEKVKE